MDKKTIKICNDYSHEDYQVPLIWTFAFSGAEYWYPYCGFTGGMLGSGEDAPTSKLLEDRQAAYKKVSQNYLIANGRKIAVATKHEGKTYRPPSTLPDEVKKQDQEYIDNWKYGQKIEV
jgi:hypothetical protein